MVKVGRHPFAPSGETDWLGRAVHCANCPLPPDNEIHELPAVSDDQRQADKRRTAER